jgi:predicted alpha/beta-hydrolase family hydrolase
VIAVGFPTVVAEREFVNEARIPKFFVHSTNDEYGPRADFEAFFETVPPPKRVDWIAAADHFFKDALDVYEATIVRIGFDRAVPRN